MQNYQNTDVHRRHWNRLVDVSTGRTLSLDAGQETTEGVLMWAQSFSKEDGVEVASEPEQGPLPRDFEDEYLKPVASKSTKGATPEPPAEALPTVDESPKE